ncbi:MAG: HAD family hydrolase [Thermodesulfobacteriota bacterium]|nr:HAD family hydrolase [Thermodesulfobacteriota bacterium]
MKTADIKIVAFDCDGVLFDTETANRAYYNEILQRMGLPEVTDEQFEYVHMHTVDASLAFLCGEDRLNEAHEHRKQTGYAPFIQYMKKAPGLDELLDRIAGRYHIAIATNRSNTMNRVLSTHGLAGRFSPVVTALDVPNPKPAPDQLHKILDYFRAAPGEMLYVGDSELDAAAAGAAGVPFIAYNNPDLPANWYVTTMDELRTLLRGNSA